MVKAYFLKLLVDSKMEWIAPVSGGGFGIFAWAVKLAPIISIVAAIIGVVLGVMSYRLKSRQARLAIELHQEQINQLKNK